MEEEARSGSSSPEPVFLRKSFVLQQAVNVGRHHSSCNLGPEFRAKFAAHHCRYHQPRYLVSWDERQCLELKILKDTQRYSEFKTS